MRSEARELVMADNVSNLDLQLGDIKPDVDHRNHANYVSLHAR